MLILGIETSCDETAIALVRDGHEVRVNKIFSQIPIHAQYGGVVPELASRNHLLKINILLKNTLEEINVTLEEVDGIAVTSGPGLVGSLLIGVSTAKALSYVFRKPLIGVNHLEGHLYANYLEHQEIAFPFLGAVFSGGHTSLIRVDDHHSYQIIGQTRDDAVGEAFDKVAKLLGLGYPGGPAVEKLAQEGDETRYQLPRPRFKTGCPLDFSFSGLKTAVMNVTRKEPDYNPADLAASFQKTAVDVLLERIRGALRQEKLSVVVLGGGVIANRYLRERLQRQVAEAGGRLYFPSRHYCTDNAAMIASLGYFRLRGGFKSDLSLNAFANMPIGESF